MTMSPWLVVALVFPLALELFVYLAAMEFLIVSNFPVSESYDAAIVLGHALEIGGEEPGEILGG